MCSDSSSVMVVSECFTENLEIALKYFHNLFKKKNTKKISWITYLVVNIINCWSFGILRIIALSSWWY